eukprot:m.239354 g.239354  ORF g.239354 m.239354 type:complete len:83 (+) comp15295_c1_seq2:425-673(+)
MPLKEEFVSYFGALRNLNGNSGIDVLEAQPSAQQNARTCTHTHTSEWVDDCTDVSSQSRNEMIVLCCQALTHLSSDTPRSNR